MKMLICGDRHWRDRLAIERVIDHFKPTHIIQGGAAGADSIAGDIAIERTLKGVQYNADWDTHGKKAGILRNVRMLEHGKPDIVIGFHDNLQYSKGTKHMLHIAQRVKVPTYLYEKHVLFEITLLYGSIPQKKRIKLKGDI